MEKQEQLATIAEKIKQNLECPLKEQATNLVFGKGNPEAKIMFIGEAPGEKEDLQGIPFVGRAGKQLDTLLHGIGLGIEDIYIANILKYRPPKNRNPTVEEIKQHTPYLIEQIKVIKPKVICPMGNFATKFVLAKFSVTDMKHIPGISQVHGKPVDMTVDGAQFMVIPMYHPAAILYRPGLRPELVADFEKVKTYLS